MAQAACKACQCNSPTEAHSAWTTNVQCTCTAPAQTTSNSPFTTSKHKLRPQLRHARPTAGGWQGGTQQQMYASGRVHAAVNASHRGWHGTRKHRPLACTFQCTTNFCIQLTQGTESPATCAACCATHNCMPTDATMQQHGGRGDCQHDLRHSCAPRTALPVSAEQCIKSTQCTTSRTWSGQCAPTS